MKKIKLKTIAIKGCTKKTEAAYKNLKAHCDRSGSKLRVKAPEALELGIQEIIKAEAK